MMSVLFTPLQLGPLTLRNRIVIPPMCQYSAKDGQATDWHLMHYGALSLSGAGLLIMEATAVEPEGRISPADLGLWSEQTEQALGRVLRAIRAYSDIPVALQLAHAGRKASTARPWDGGEPIPLAQGGWTTFAPSALPYAPDHPVPHALDKDELTRIKNAFVAAALSAQRLGFDGIELHSAHGYLLHSFLSPLSNQRTDEYGGDLENRMRFPLEVFSALRAALDPKLPLGVRISGTDWVAGGWDIEQSVLFTQRLKALGSAYIHVSSGGLSPTQQITLGPGYQVPVAERVKRETGLTTIAVGLITQARQAEAIIVEERADLVALGRAMLYNPRWPWHAAAELGAQVDAPAQYHRSQPHGLKQLFKPLGS
jgi:2,4-dienoyl-CoA reductase-like NADH-dependent reductase (Old Yellow Enzyme family)